MRWPWQRRRDDEARDPVGGAATGAPAASAPRPRGQWRDVEPLQPAGAAELSAAEPLEFVRTLSTRWQVPPALEPLGHEVSITAPAGHVPVAGAPVTGTRTRQSWCGPPCPTTLPRSLGTPGGAARPPAPTSPRWSRRRWSRRGRRSSSSRCPRRGPPRPTAPSRWLPHRECVISSVTRTRCRCSGPVVLSSRRQRRPPPRRSRRPTSRALSTGRCAVPCLPPPRWGSPVRPAPSRRSSRSPLSPARGPLTNPPSRLSWIGPRPPSRRQAGGAAAASSLRVESAAPADAPRVVSAEPVAAAPVRTVRPVVSRRPALAEPPSLRAVAEDPEAAADAPSRRARAAAVVRPADGTRSRCAGLVLERPLAARDA